MGVLTRRFGFRKMPDTCELTVQSLGGYMMTYHFPITYTLEDCLEWWCASQGENFISFETRIKQPTGCTGKFKYHGRY